MNNEQHWFFKKWGLLPPTPLDSVYAKIEKLEERISNLEKETVGQSNALYEYWNSTDARIDELKRG